MTYWKVIQNTVGQTDTDGEVDTEFILTFGEANICCFECVDNQASKQEFLQKNGGNIMSKKYYPIEDVVNNVSQKFKLGLKDANEMNEEEFNNAEEYILKYVKFVSHPDYVQLIPQSLETGEYIL